MMTDVLIDSGVACNIVNHSACENLRHRGVKCESYVNAKRNNLPMAKQILYRQSKHHSQSEI